MTERRSGSLGWLRLIAYPILLLLLYQLGAWWARQMTYPIPTPQRGSPPEPIRAVALETEPGQMVRAYFLPCPREAAPVVVFFHGGGQDLDNLVDSGFIQRFPTLGVHLLAIDYPGYGTSSGAPSEARIADAADAAMDWAIINYPDAPKVIMGWALGAAVAVQTAQRFKGQYDGLVLVSAWRDLPSAADHHTPRWLVRLLWRERYDAANAATGLQAPSLVIHGSLDDVVPIDQGRLVARILGAHGACEFVAVTDRGHDDIMDASLTWLKLRHFLQAFAATTD